MSGVGAAGQEAGDDLQAPTQRVEQRVRGRGDAGRPIKERGDAFRRRDTPELFDDQIRRSGIRTMAAARRRKRRIPDDRISQTDIVQAHTQASPVKTHRSADGQRPECVEPIEGDHQRPASKLGGGQRGNAAVEIEIRAALEEGQHGAARRAGQDVRQPG
ncbi:MAG: hypothetical protein A2Z07_12615 [Armatimonadetes bacterium RBG_16_67_12]|nr:MAG: hypothetical protein A2Z07_12615 [Armatimonadetes bacterium RBG_16_67_12]